MTLTTASLLSLLETFAGSLGGDGLESRTLSESADLLRLFADELDHQDRQLRFAAREA